MQILTGVGSRKVPRHIMSLMWQLGYHAAINGWTFRSGRAIGSDTAFELGYYAGGGRHAELYITEDIGSNPDRIVLTDEMYNEAVDYILKYNIIPWWNSLGYGGKRLHARNYWEIVGISRSISNYCIFWCPWDDTKSDWVGGTRTAIKIANKMGVELFNLDSSLDLLSLQQKFNFKFNK